MSVHPSLVTPPQARDEQRHTTHANIVIFFDPLTYRRDRVDQTKTVSESGGCGERHTTRENIIKFFDMKHYQRQCSDHERVNQGCTTCQKRPASEASSSQPAVAKAKTMSKQELLEKFKLAAELNGIDWGDMTVS